VAENCEPFVDLGDDLGLSARLLLVPNYPRCSLLPLFAQHLLLHCIPAVATWSAEATRLNSSANQICEQFGVSSLASPHAKVVDAFFGSSGHYSFPPKKVRRVLIDESHITQDLV